MRKYLFLSFLTGVCLTFSCVSQKEQQESATVAETLKPNIIFIMADDLGYGDVGFNGQQKIKTPVLDQMASKGKVFTRHYAGSTVCGPSRASLMTGLHTGHSTVRGNPAWTLSGKPVDIDEDITVAEELKRAGYTTGIVGKWGLAENLDTGKPHRQGFDYFYGFNRHVPAHHYYPEELWENDSLFEVTGNVMREKKGIYAQDLFTEKALTFIEREHTGPFFLYLAFTIPHYELTIPEDQKIQYAQEGWPLRKMKMGHYRNDENGHVTYASMVTRMDKDVGKILNKLEEIGIADNTLVIFTSDNGHEYDNVNDEFFNSNSILRGKKRDLYEGGIRVPFVAYWPGKIAAGTKSNHVSAFWDFLPTACDIAGLKPTARIDGISYLPTLLGNEERQKSHEYLYWEFNESQGPIQAILQDEWKLINFVDGPTELYQITEDQVEKQNLISQYPEKAKYLRRMLQQVRREHPEFPLTKRERSQ